MKGIFLYHCLHSSRLHNTATLFQTVVIATGQYQPQVVRKPPAKEGVESGCNNIIHECCIVVAKEKTVQK